MLNDNTWEQIKSVAAAGVAPSAWSVGDCKQIVLNGTLTDGIGSITLENFFACVFILGFNHNADLEGNNTIHFMLGKSTLSGGKDITLSDSLN